MSAISLFEEKQVPPAWNAAQEKWVFAIVDVLAILTDSPNPQVYWRVLKKRLTDEGNETVTNCNGLKMTAADGKQRMTDVADTEQLLRLIQSIPSPKAEPFKRWLAKVGYERLEEIENPELAAKRIRGPRPQTWPIQLVWEFEYGLSGNLNMIDFLSEDGGIASTELIDQAHLPIVRMAGARGVETQRKELRELLHGGIRMSIVVDGIALRPPGLGTEVEWQLLVARLGGAVVRLFGKGFPLTFRGRCGCFGLVN